MARVAPTIPEETALLCEKCGYIINGISAESVCPECATPIVESLPDTRQPPLWEQQRGSAISRFILTREDDDQWRCGVVRHWALDGIDPRVP